MVQVKIYGPLSAHEARHDREKRNKLRPWAWTATALFKRGARADQEILERGVLACYIDTIILFAGDLFYSLVTELWDHLYISVQKIELKKTDSAENSFNTVSVKKEKKAPPPLKPLAFLLLYQIWIQSTLA